MRKHLSLSSLLASLLLLLSSSPQPSHSYAPISDKTLKNISPPTDSDFNIKTGRLLSPILIPRVPGTPNSLKVLQHFSDFFARNLPDWKVSYDNSTSTTPLSKGKKVPFRNFIATRDPPWAKDGELGRLVLVAHYDSKIFPEGFIGATDSAAPCAMILHAAKSIDEALSRKWRAMEENKKLGGDDVLDSLDDDTVKVVMDRGVMVLFLDGEEAFENWSDKDSLYGARNLASVWESTHHPANSPRHNYLSSIDLFLLLDLLGSKNPRVPSYFPTTHWAYKSMSDLEQRLRNLNLFKTGNPTPKDRHKNFLPDYSKSLTPFQPWMVQDDHIPFLKRGVEVLHIIPTPFPGVWHQIGDDGEHLDIPTVYDWAMLTTAFAAEWLELEGHFDY